MQLQSAEGLQLSAGDHKVGSRGQNLVAATSRRLLATSRRDASHVQSGFGLVLGGETDSYFFTVLPDGALENI